MTRYEVVESRVWQRDDGAKASIFGAMPWTSEQEKTRWQVVSQGWTVRDNKTNTVGMGRPPFPRQEDASRFAQLMAARELLGEAQAMRLKLLAQFGCVPECVLDFCNKARQLLG